MSDTGAFASASAALSGGGVVDKPDTGVLFASGALLVGVAVVYGGDTLLTITGAGVPPYSARGLQQTLTPIQAASVLKRTVNGALQDISAVQFRKYSSAITCTDQQAPAFAALWPGMNVTVECVAELICFSGIPFERPAVAGSVVALDGYTIYRPRLEMRVTAFNEQIDEYGRTVQWELDLEEI